MKIHVCVHAKSLQLCPTFCDPMDPMEPSRLLRPWDFPGKNTGVGCHFLLQGNLPDPGIEPVSGMSPALAGGFFTTSVTREAPDNMQMKYSFLGSYLSIQSCPSTRIIGIQRKSEGKVASGVHAKVPLRCPSCLSLFGFGLFQSSLAAVKLTALNGRL